jgi:hypothetical protein
MGLTFKATTVSAGAPNIEPALYDARFDGIDVKFITGGQYGDGERLEWSFTLLDDDGAVMYDDGDPIEVNGLTSTSMNVLSKTTPRAVRYLKALMTPAEYGAFEAGEGIDEKALLGRTAQVEVAIKDSGWPTIANVLAARKARPGKAQPGRTPDPKFDIAPEEA